MGVYFYSKKTDIIQIYHLKFADSLIGKQRFDRFGASYSAINLQIKNWAYLVHATSEFVVQL